MTVIAYNYGTREIAVDSLCVGGGRKYYVEKFRALDDGNLLFVCGVYSALTKAKNLFNKGKGLTEGMVANSIFVLFDPKSGDCQEFNETTEKKLIVSNDAQGTGADFALGALEVGASASRAVEVSCKYSDSCGVRFLRLDHTNSRICNNYIIY